jgi:hypothetical protein
VSLVGLEIEHFGFPCAKLLTTRPVRLAICWNGWPRLVPSVGPFSASEASEGQHSSSLCNSMFYRTHDTYYTPRVFVRALTLAKRRLCGMQISSSHFFMRWNCCTSAHGAIRSNFPSSVGIVPTMRGCSPFKMAWRSVLTISRPSAAVPASRPPPCRLDMRSGPAR